MLFFIHALLQSCLSFRFGNSQLHPVAAVMGGVVSQELLKVSLLHLDPPETLTWIDVRW